MEPNLEMFNVEWNHDFLNQESRNEKSVCGEQ